MNITRKIYHNLESKGFTGIIITGEPAVGKSMLACAIAREIASTDKIAPEFKSKKAWEWAIKNCVYTPKRFSEELEGYDFYHKRRIIIWEDIGTTADKYAFTLGFKYLHYLKANMDLIRTNLDCLIMTTPSEAELLDFLGAYGFLKIEVTRYADQGRKYRRLATTYHKVNKSKSGSIRRVWQKWFYDLYDCYAPEDMYKLYLEHSKREAVSTDLRKKMVEAYETSSKRMLLNNMKLDKELKELKNEDKGT